MAFPLDRGWGAVVVASTVQGGIILHLGQHIVVHERETVSMPVLEHFPEAVRKEAPLHPFVAKRKRIEKFRNLPNKIFISSILTAHLDGTYCNIRSQSLYYLLPTWRLQNIKHGALPRDSARKGGSR